MADKKSILFITVTFPPRLSVASLRLYNYAKLFHQNEWDVHVITCELEPQNTSDEFDLSIFNINKVAWKDPYQIINKVKNKTIKKVLTKTLSLIISQNPIWLPDIRFQSWRKNAIILADKIIKKEKITHIYTTFSPISPHLLGKKIKLNHRELYWLAEYRDLCSFSASNNWIKKTLKDLHFKLEKEIIRESDLIMTVSKGQQAIMQKKLSQKVHLLYNGCDFDSYFELPESNNEFSIVYTGNYSKKFNDLELFFKSIKEFIAISKNNSQPIRIIFAGTPKDRFILNKIRRYSLEKHCVFLKKMPNLQIKKIQKSASILLHFVWNDKKQKGILSGKIFEYISAQKPILSIGYDKELSDLLLPFNGKTLQKQSQIVKYLVKNYGKSKKTKYWNNKSSLISKENQFKNLEKIISQ